MTNNSLNTSSKPVLNIKFEGFWDKDDIIFEHYFKTSHCFLDEVYDVRLNPHQPDVVFASIFGGAGSYSFPPSIPKILLIHENQTVQKDPFFDKFDYVISFTKDSTQPNNIRIPYWVYRTFDSIAAFGGTHEGLVKYLTIERPLEQHDRGEFCAYMHGKPVAYREKMVRALSEYKKVDCGGSHLYNLEPGPEADYMKQRLYGRKALNQKEAFFSKRNFGFAMENSWAPGYVTEKIIDVVVAGCIPLYCGIMLDEDGFNPDAILNLYNYDSIVPYIEEVKRIDDTDDLEEMAFRPVFKSYPERFTKAAMIDTYQKMFERKYIV
jgi:hypothetical protein